MTAMRLKRYPSPSGGLALGKMGVGATMLGGWRNPYVTNGLIAMYDGEWNAGPGVHDTASCKNLIADMWHGIVGADVVIGSNYFEFDGVRNVTHAISLGNAWFGMPQYLTAEVCYEILGAGAQATQCPLGGSEGGKNFAFIQWEASNSGRASWYGISTTPRSNWPNSMRLTQISGIGIATQAWGLDSLLACGSIYGADKSIYLTAENSIGAVAAYNSSYNCYIGTDAYNPTEYALNGRVYCCRVYNRRLTEQELQSNAAVDQERFNLP